MPSEQPSKRGVRLCWLGVVVTTFGLLGACTNEEELPGASDQTTPASGGGHAAVTGGTGSVGTGGAGAVGSGGTGGGPLSTGGTWTEADWEAATAPIVGPHEIWTIPSCDPPELGSDSVQVGPEYSVIPTLNYPQAADFASEMNQAYDAFLVDSCLTSADCSEQPRGVCRGALGDAYCEYPDRPVESCAADADCTTKPDGSCVFPFSPEPDRICYPTGECVEPAGACAYAGNAPCTGDVDCSEQAGGRCVFPIAWTGCWYDSCSEDADCESGHRCLCGSCVVAQCETAEECGEGEVCALSPGFCLEGHSYHCTTPGDECEPGETYCHYESQPGGIGIWIVGHCLI
jgi:hypothetical protein